MQHARERLYLTADKARLVREGDPKAAFLYAAKGDEIPESAAEKFGLVDGQLKLKAAKALLLGSSILPAVVAITETLSVQLGAVVARAHKASGLSADDWNALPEPDREDRLAKTVEEMKSEAASRPALSAPKKSAVKEQEPAQDKEQKAPENKGS